MNMLTQPLRSAPFLIILSLACIEVEFNIPNLYFFSFHRVFNAKEPLTLSFVVGVTLACIFLLPLLINQLTLREPLKNFGLVLPPRKKTLALLLCALLLLLPPTLFLAQQPVVKHFYTLKDVSRGMLVFTFLLAYPPYYLAEEFFFRGFLFLRLQRNLGWHSYWITEVIFMWAHLGKPPLEIIFSFPAGLALNFITAQTKSIYPAMIAHFILGVALLSAATFFS